MNAKQQSAQQPRRSGTRRQQHETSAAERYGRRQPRPAPRRTGTRSGAVAAAIREG